MVPLALRFHCWLVCPLQSKVTTCVPLVVPWLNASRHLEPRTINWRLEVAVQDWLGWPLQSHSCTWVPLVVVAFGTSTQRLDWAPTICRPWLAASGPVAVSRTAWPAGTVVVKPVVKLPRLVAVQTLRTLAEPVRPSADQRAVMAAAEPVRLSSTTARRPLPDW